MAKKLVIFLGAAAAAAVLTGVVARKRRGGSQGPLLDNAVGKSKKMATDWQADDDAISSEFASVVADEVAAAR